MTSGSQGPRAAPWQAALDTLYLQLADTLERTAELAEQHAQRQRETGKPQTVAIELERAERARMAARRARALARRSQAGNPDPPTDFGV
jgi:hypothetical protein